MRLVFTGVAYLAIALFLVGGVWGAHFQDVSAGVVAGLALAYLCMWAFVEECLDA
jgi:hypothetical protein